MAQQAGRVTFEVESLNGQDVLHCYLPKELASSAVPTYDEESLKTGHGVSIFFDVPEQEHVGTVVLNDYVMPNPIQAKFSKKHARYTFNLLKAAPSATEDSDAAADQGAGTGQRQQPDAASSNGGHAAPPSGQVSAEPLALDELCTQQGLANGHHADTTQQQQQQQHGSADVLSEKQRAGGDPDEADVAGDEDDEGEDEDGEDGQGKKGKKRRGQRKKKKKGKAPAAADGDGGAGATEAAAAGAGADADAAPAPAPARPSSPDADEDEQFEDALDHVSDSGDDAPSGTVSPARPPAPVAAAPVAAAAVAAAAPALHVQPPEPPAAPFGATTCADWFADEPCAGTTQLPAPGGEPHQPPSLLQGPTVAACLDRHEHKGEDKGLKVLGGTWTPAGSSASVPFSAFGIFDGHGGKPAATFASKELLPTIMRLLDRCVRGGASGSSHAALAAAAAALEAEQGAGDSWGVEVTQADRDVWAAQEAMAERLPMAMFAGFLEADKVCCRRFKSSGTTATLVVVVGWEVFVANVGDSAAYLDTGKQVITLTANHRVDDNQAERERVLAAGGEIGKSTCDETGKPVGPDRVWPGGLAMSRTIGDQGAPQVIAVPEVRHVTVPTTGGRIVIASDGVWDHMQPKSMIHQVRNDNTEAAAKKISVAALRKKGLRDDISALVIDLLPAPGDPRPPALLPGAAREAAEAVQIIRPLHEACGGDGSVSPGGKGSSSGGGGGDAVPAGDDGHWREAAAERRVAALRLLRAQACAAAEAAAAEAAREAAAAAEAAAAEEAQARESETYRQLRELKVDAAELAQQLERQRAAAGAGAGAQAAGSRQADGGDGWTTVVGRVSSSAGEDEDDEDDEGDGYVSLEKQLRARARHLVLDPEQPAAAGGARGGGRGGGRGGRGGRGGGRGDPRSSSDAADAGMHGHEQQQQQQQHAAGLRHSRGDFEPRGRGRGGARGGRRQDGRWQPEEAAGADYGYTTPGGRGRGGGRGGGQPHHQLDAGAHEGHVRDQQHADRGGRGSGRGRGGRAPVAAAPGSDSFGQGFGLAADAHGAGAAALPQRAPGRRRPDRVHGVPADSAEAAAANSAVDAVLHRPMPSATHTAQHQHHQQPPQQQQHGEGEAREKRRPRGPGGPCFICKQPGHLARDCTSEAAATWASGGSAVAAAAAPAPAAPAPAESATGGGGGRGGVASGPACYLCHQPGHKAKSCPNPPPATGDAHAAPAAPAAMLCRACHQPGHKARSCPNVAPAPAALGAAASAHDMCHKCKQTGHWSRDCPNPRVPDELFPGGVKPAARGVRGGAGRPRGRQPTSGAPAPAAAAP